MTRIRRALAHLGKGAATRQDGQVLALFAAGLVGFCGFVGLSIDIGKLVYTASDIQKIADAAALAGSQDLPSTSTATLSANEFAAENGDAVIAIAFQESNTKIRVTATRNVDYTFLRVLGLDGRSLSRSATARATQQTITGYNWEAVAPFIIWGGSRQSEVNPGDQHCELHTCVGKSYTFMDTGWMNASGSPTSPDWTANGSNNFKGDVNHGDGAPVNHIGETFSVGGLGSVATPSVGELLVIPIVDKASGNSDMRSFRIAAWAVVKVAPGCKKAACKGIIQGTSVDPPTGWATGGSALPPGSLAYQGTLHGLVE